MRSERGCQLSSMVCTRMKTLSQISPRRAGPCSFYKMELNTKVNGTSKLITVMEGATRFGQMEASTRATGKTTRLTAEEG